MSWFKVLFAVPSGKHLHNYGKSPYFSWEVYYFYGDFYSYVKLPDVRIYGILWCRYIMIYLYHSIGL